MSSSEREVSQPLDDGVYPSMICRSSSDLFLLPNLEYTLSASLLQTEVMKGLRGQRDLEDSNST